MERLRDKICLVTGGASGLGEACSRRFAAEGAQVVVVDVRPQPADLAAQFHDSEGRVSYEQADVTSPEQFSQVVDRVRDRFGTIDVLHANAGRLIIGDGPVHETPIESWDQLFNLNVIGAFISCRYVLPVMLEARKGAIVVSSSIGARGGGLPCYSSSKAALLGLMRSIAARYRDEGIRCNAITPGSHDTPIRDNNGVPNDRDILVQTVIQMRRLGDPAEVAALVTFLVSDDASAMTGNAYAVDGGMN
jgi:meso-butanediol dehydrogenase / (S,S)-butanediol dehydrogenase / diacetyl reductase